MNKVSYDKFDEYAQSFDADFNWTAERLKNREAMAEKLADLLNAKIDECEELKSEITRLNNLIDSMELTVNMDKWVRS